MSTEQQVETVFHRITNWKADWNEVKKLLISPCYCYQLIQLEKLYDNELIVTPTTYILTKCIEDNDFDYYFLFTRKMVKLPNIPSIIQHARKEQLRLFYNKIVNSVNLDDMNQLFNAVINRDDYEITYNILNPLLCKYGPYFRKFIYDNNMVYHHQNVISAILAGMFLSEDFTTNLDCTAKFLTSCLEYQCTKEPILIKTLRFIKSTMEMSYSKAEYLAVLKIRTILKQYVKMSKDEYLDSIVQFAPHFIDTMIMDDNEIHLFDQMYIIDVDEFYRKMSSSASNFGNYRIVELIEDNLDDAFHYWNAQNIEFYNMVNLPDIEHISPIMVVYTYRYHLEEMIAYHTCHNNVPIHYYETFRILCSDFKIDPSFIKNSAIWEIEMKFFNQGKETCVDIDVIRGFLPSKIVISNRGKESI